MPLQAASRNDCLSFQHPQQCQKSHGLQWPISLEVSQAGHQEGSLPFPFTVLRLHIVTPKQLICATEPAWDPRKFSARFRNIQYVFLNSEQTRKETKQKMQELLSHSRRCQVDANHFKNTISWDLWLRSEVKVHWKSLKCSVSTTLYKKTISTQVSRTRSPQVPGPASGLVGARSGWPWSTASV